MSAPVAQAAPLTAPVQESGPRIDVNELDKGSNEKETRQLLGPSRTLLSECSAGKGGILRLRIRSTDRSASIDVEPGTSLDAPTRTCALEALSIIDFPAVIAESNASTQPRIFSSLVTISW